MKKNKDSIRPFGEKLLKRILPEGESESIAGDYEELYQDLSQKKGIFYSTLWYWLQIIKSFWVGITVSIHWSVIMFNNYFKIMLRNLKKNKAFSLINISGLTVGLTLSILIMLYVRYELTFDNFHPRADQTYRVVQSNSRDGRDLYNARTGDGLMRALKNEFPEIQSVTRLDPVSSSMGIEFSYKDKRYIERKGGFRTDPSVFDVFKISLVRGDPETALKKPESIVMNEEMAYKYFGDEDPIGKTINVTIFAGQHPKKFIITGIAIAMPGNSHFQFTFLSPLGEGAIDTKPRYSANFVGTYVVLPEDYPPRHLEEKFPLLVRKYIGPEIESSSGISYNEWLNSGGKHRLHLQPLKEIYLDSYYRGDYSLKGSRTNIYLFSIISFFILLIAAVNFMNLSTAKSATRAREVGVRKVLGSQSRQLIGQFLAESIFVSFLALVFAVFLVKLLLPAFNNFLSTKITFGFFESGFTIPVLIGIAVLTGLLAGIYPAFFLSSFKPVTVIKGIFRERSGGVTFRNGLVVFQFLISIVLIIASLVVFSQLSYMRKKDPGFYNEQIIVIKNVSMLFQMNRLELPGEERVMRYETLRQEILKHSNVINASVSSGVPGINRYISAAGNIRAEGTSVDRQFTMNMYWVDTGFIDTYGLKLVSGRNFTQSANQSKISSPEGIILNETAVKYFGWTENNEKFILHRKSISVRKEGKLTFQWYDAKIPVIGIVNDFNFRTFHNEIQPIGFQPIRGANNFMSVRIGSNDIQSTLEFLEETWKKFVPVWPFEYFFLDDSMEIQYRKEEKLSKIFNYFALLAIFIACLGMFGLVSYTAEQRTKEIGIRKVLGAGVQDILRLLSRNFLFPVLISYIIACPAAYYFMDKWLEDFAYRTDLGPGIFLFSGLAALVIVLLSVGFQALKAAIANPVDTLKYE
ncbi:FtsX-like permease family protein [candidate division KSB1 bacterium]